MNQRDGIAWLIESLQKCRMMIKHAGNAIFTIDPESGRLLEANIKAEEMTGYSESELRGLEVWDLHPEGEKETTKELFDRVVSTGKAEECDMSLASKDGGVVRVDVSASMIEFGGTRIIQRICKDVTDRRELEARNEEQRRYYENILNMMPVGLGVRKNPGENPTIEFE
ncbi:MAG: PAS domain S-box protein, partial [Candidatus Krumholzibacteria bacterium]|nr:PAS domain S-box protein [Candidatus Krumholzibacteria bacterium]